MEKEEKKITKKQKQVLDYIKQYQAKNKFPPAVREICRALNLSSPATVHTHINNLTSKGYLKRCDNGSRNLEILVPNEYENIDEKVINVPLLGKITAGNPIEAIEVPNEVFPLPTYLVPNKKEVFTLKVDGDSMINAGIHSNDVVIIERCSNAKNGDIVAAMNDENEVTLKTFYKEDGYFRLQPENDFMAPIILPNVTILGKAIGLYRKF